MNFNEFLQHFDHVKMISPSEAVCSCPCKQNHKHGDIHPSLSVSQKGDRILMHCFCGCSNSEIAAAAGFQMSDLFSDEDQAWIKYVEGRTHEHFVTSYDYTDLDGHYLHTKVRLVDDQGEKHFEIGILDPVKHMFHFGSNDHGKPCIFGSVSKVKKAIADGETVYITEGEKDTLTMSSKGYTAVTYGSSTSWNPDEAELFKGAKVVILADDDSNGHKVAKQIKKDLDGVAESTKIILPDPNGIGGDITDYFSDGHDMDDFKKMLQNPESDLSDTEEDDLISFNEFVPFEKQSDRNLPEFPVDSFPDVLRTYALAVAESYQVPIDAPANMILGALSTCVQGKFQIEVKHDWVEPVNLYTAIVMRPSERKTPVQKEVYTRPINDYVARRNEEMADDLLEYEVEKKVLTGRIKHIQESLSKQNKNAKNSYTKQDLIEAEKELNELKEVKPLQMILDDATPEALVNSMKDNYQRMSIVSTEGGIFGMLAGRYSDNVNLDVYLKSYSCEYLSVARVSRDFVEMEKPSLTISLAVQPQIITDIMDNAEFRGRGLLARFLYSIPNSKVGSRIYRTDEVDSDDRDAYDNLLEDLMDIPEGKRTIKLVYDSTVVSEEYNQMIEKRLNEDLEPIEDWAGKLHGNTMRIAALLHIVKYKDRADKVFLEPDTLQAAINIGMYYIDHAKAAFDIMGMAESQDEKDAKNILSHCVTKDKCDIRDKTCSFTKRDALRMCRSFHKAEELDAGLECLEDRGYIAIVKEKPKNGGRVSERIYVNPEYLETLK